MTRRTERIADLLRSEISQVLVQEIRDPRIQMTTVVDIDISPDLRHARVRVSVLGEEIERQEGVAALRHARGYIRSALAHRLRLRAVPELDFELDRGAEHSQRISELLESLDDNEST
jgi:ribosome-binding factor A